jgi:DNA primase catalytic core
MSAIDWDGLKSRHSLADVARRSGIEVGATGRVMICCPIPAHHDSTPSAQLDLDRNRYHCFGCGAGGDVIDWVRDIEDVDTSTAVAILESRRPINAVFVPGSDHFARLRPQHEGPQLDRTSLERVLEANQAAWSYYSQPGPHQTAVAYIARRRLDISTLEELTGEPVIGYTPHPNQLVRHLAGCGFVDNELVDSGLATRTGDGSLIDLFRNRVILPVTDGAGSIIAILGRDVTGTSPVKYLNPPTTVAYRKSQALYQPARPVLASDGGAIVCEGPIDALAIASNAAIAGLSDRYAPVSACGITLSDNQLRHILDLHPRAPVLAADGDPPGRQANLDWARRMLHMGRESVITDWPDGHDPASWLAEHGPSGLIALTRRGCLTNTSDQLHPRHCGAALSVADLRQAAWHSNTERAALLRSIETATARLPPAARRRYRTAANSVIRPDRTRPPLVTDCSDYQPTPHERIVL